MSGERNGWWHVENYLSGGAGIADLDRTIIDGLSPDVAEAVVKAHNDVVYRWETETGIKSLFPGARATPPAA